MSGFDSDTQRHTVTRATILGDVEKEKGKVNPVHMMNVYGRALHIITSALDGKWALQRPNFDVQY